jgi:hypothetical protein
MELVVPPVPAGGAQYLVSVSELRALISGATKLAAHGRYTHVKARRKDRSSQA